MPKIPGIDAAQAVRVLQAIGYRIIRQGKHTVMSDGMTKVSIPRHNPINAYTMGSIARDVGLTPDEFRQLL